MKQPQQAEMEREISRMPRTIPRRSRSEVRLALRAQRLLHDQIGTQVGGCEH